MPTSPSDPIQLLPVDEDVPDLPAGEGAGNAELVDVEVIDDRRDVARSDTSLQWSLLLVSAAVLALAAILQVRGPETVVVPVIDVALPGTCTYKQFVGAECPGCGLTRCFISMAHGRPVAAWYFNPAGILFFSIVAVQLPFRGFQIWRIRRGLPELRLRLISHGLLGLLIASLIIQWLVRTYF